MGLTPGVDDDEEDDDEDDDEDSGVSLWSATLLCATILQGRAAPTLSHFYTPQSSVWEIK